MERTGTIAQDELVEALERATKRIDALEAMCERAVEALRYEAHPVCDEWDAFVGVAA